MSASKLTAAYTPGPWDVRTLENFGWNVVHYRNGDKFDIVRVAKANKEEDARLIAAAPEMLAALERQAANIARWIETGEPAGREESKSISDQICAAIAKATGRAMLEEG